jgi:hypothetical protein
MRFTVQDNKSKRRMGIETLQPIVVWMYYFGPTFALLVYCLRGCCTYHPNSNVSGDHPVGGEEQNYPDGKPLQRG